MVNMVIRLRGISMYRTNVKGLKLKRDILDDDYYSWEVCHRFGAPVQQSVKAACKLLLDTTHTEALRSYASCEYKRKDRGSDYNCAYLQLEVPVHVIVRCDMSALRVAWIAAVVTTTARS